MYLKFDRKVSQHHEMQRKEWRVEPKIVEPAQASNGADERQVTTSIENQRLTSLGPVAELWRARR